MSSGGSGGGFGWVQPPGGEGGPGGGPSLTPEQAAAAFKKAVKIFGGIIVLLLIVIGLYSSAYTVQAEQKGIVKRFGKIVDVNMPGLHFKMPFGIDRVQLVATERVLKEEFGFQTVQSGQRTTYSESDFRDESLMLTGDLNVIDVEWVVQYKITNPENYLYRGLRDPTESIRAVSEAVMRRIIGNRLGSDALTVGRVEIAAMAEQEIQDILDKYKAGITIQRVEMQDVTPPDRVKPAFNAVNEARQESERLINQAEGERNKVIPKAIGEAKQTISESEGYAIERVNRAKGEASRFLSILKEYRDAPEVTRRRLYLEMMEKVVNSAGQVYVMPESGTSPIPLLELNKSAEGGATK